MSRKQKIIISVTGIFIVLLILVGLTYAYFLTRISGNTNTKSISVTTADLKLTYGDGNGDITAEKIEPGTIIDTKTFTVTNEGNATVNNYAVYLEELVNTLNRTSDMVYTLTCTSNVENKTCNGKTETIFPTQNGMLVTNNIDVKETQSYELKVEYKEMNVDQSEDMNKAISAKVQIYNLSDIVDITGTVTNASDGDYVEMQSTPKTSQISGNKYFIPAIEPGVHTLYVKDSKGTVKGSKQITINKGSESSVNGDTITVTRNSQTISINITSISNTLTTDIGDVKDYNPFTNGTLAYKIYSSATNINDGEVSLGYAKYSAIPLSEPADEISKENESTLSETEDDYGTSYYFRGNVKNNYVDFAGMCFRIVRIEGDGSIKLALENIALTCENSDGAKRTNIGQSNYGYDNSGGKINKANYRNPVTDEDTSMTHAFKYFQDDTLRTLTLATKFKSNYPDKTYDDYLKSGDWCINDTAYEKGATSTQKEIDKDIYYSNKQSFDYDSKVRLYNAKDKNPTLKCNGTSFSTFSDDSKMFVGALTVDEIVYAGGKVYENNTNYYLRNSDIYWRTISLCEFDGTNDYSYTVNPSGLLTNYYVSFVQYAWNSGASPAIRLKTGISYNSGDGSINNPYLIK